jgi:hypothetical protein
VKSMGGFQAAKPMPGRFWKKTNPGKINNPIYRTSAKYLTRDFVAILCHYGRLACR